MANVLLEEMYRINYVATAEAIISFIRETVNSSNASGVVLGLSGGVDSSAVAVLSVKALGPDRVLGIIMPTDFTPRQDLEHAEMLARNLGIETRYIPITSIVEEYARQLNVPLSHVDAKIPYANLRARVRMSILYFHANLLNRLVAGTGDRSEILLGYYTKYGDAGVDFLPIGNIYKTQLRHLCKHLGLPDEIAFKPSSPQLYPGHRAVDELPADYTILDPILHALFDQNLSIDQVVAQNFERKIVEEVWRRYVASMHKRAMPPIGPKPIR
uniref:NH(3)-dependent NAD(+) synthetase n=1 Tax=Caldiarchaeum subterraneum TaxID=311458 RepID=A0A7C5Y4I9_CALS0